MGEFAAGDDIGAEEVVPARRAGVGPLASLAIALTAVVLAVAAVLAVNTAMQSAPPRFRAEAQVALLPGRQVPPAEVANYWEALSRGQAGRIAAEVLGQRRWLAPAASSAGAPVESLSVTAGVVADTSLINVAAEANSPREAEDVVSAVIREARPVVEQVAGQFAVEIVQPAEGGAVPIGSSRVQVLALAGAVGLLIGGGLGLLAVRLRAAWVARRLTPAKPTPADPAWVADQLAMASRSAVVGPPSVSGRPTSVDEPSGAGQVSVVERPTAAEQSGADRSGAVAQAAIVDKPTVAILSATTTEPAPQLNGKIQETWLRPSPRPRQMAPTEDSDRAQSAGGRADPIEPTLTSG